MRPSVDNHRLSRRRFLAAAGVATGMTGATAAERLLAAPAPDLAARFEEASRADAGADGQRRRSWGRAARPPGGPGAVPRLWHGPSRCAVPDRVADEGDDRVGGVVAPRSARVGADRCGARSSCPTSAAASAAPSRSNTCSRTRRACPTCCRTTPSCAASTRRCRSSWPERAARRCSFARRRGQLPEHGHPAGGGDRREGRRRADAGVPARTFSPRWA